MNADDTDQLLEQVAQGDQVSWGVLLTRHQEWLHRMVATRLDPRLRTRIDPSDVLQEVCLEACTRVSEYLRTRPMPFFLWLRFLTRQRLALLHRQHLRVGKRSVTREVPLGGADPQPSSAVLASRLMADGLRPSDAAVRNEGQRRLEQALEGLAACDREILALRHAERLSRGEAAQVLGISEAAAAKRFFRALRRLKQRLQKLPNGTGEGAVPAG